MKFNKKKYNEDGYFVVKKIITKKDIDLFFFEIDKILRVNKYKNFEVFFKVKKSRNLVYQKLQKLSSVRKITEKVIKKIEKTNILTNLSFSAPTIYDSLMVSLPHDQKNLNPLHQDIYNFTSFNFIKLWLPLTKVDKKNGSMEVYKSSNKLGFLKPHYTSSESTYPIIDQKYVNMHESVIFDLEPGDCVFFHPLLIHRGVNNTSKNTRFTIGIDIQGFDIKGNSNTVNKNFNQVKKVVDELNIPFIDIYNLLFKDEKNHKKFFPFERNGHYNKEGYKKIAEIIYTQIK